jgi:DNA helicase-2/ATP-dependent DNA helicase PcrA
VSNTVSLEILWEEVDFEPNSEQEQAIRHTQGPLYLTAGPGSGKTRVVLWRTVNLIVRHGVKPKEIFLSTFTEKAAKQLREGLRVLLNIASNHTGQPYDIAEMYIGTTHSLCQQMLADRRFAPGTTREKSPRLLDELGQYFYLYQRSTWEDLTSRVDLGEEPEKTINAYFEGFESSSRHRAIVNCRALFNRLSEEYISPDKAKAQTDNETLDALLDLYSEYRKHLEKERQVPHTDFSLLQQHAVRLLDNAPQEALGAFRHVIIDEYQDTNTIQEQLFFKLAAAHQNLCVVGDDDQALYRFRGATVENFVDFPDRCKEEWGVSPKTIPLNLNYRSRSEIVDFYTDFIEKCDWSRGDGAGSYRVEEKEIVPHSDDSGPAVTVTEPSHPDSACADTANLVRRLIDAGKVSDPSEIAFLFPSLKSKQVDRMREALEDVDLDVYAPRAGRFLEVQEATEMFGVLLHVFGKPSKGPYSGGEYDDFHQWLNQALEKGNDIIQADPQLDEYVQDRKGEIRTAIRDYQALMEVVEEKGWDQDEPYDIDSMKRPLHEADGLSERGKKGVGGYYFEQTARERKKKGNPFSLQYVVRRATSLDWNVLDVFYHICGFDHFKSMFDKAQNGGDDAPVCNLSLVSQYLGRFVDEYSPVLTASLLQGGSFRHLFFGSYLYALFRLEESEYEDADDPFPSGRIPFLTVHQAKGLEFPVVVLGNPRKDDRGPQRVEEIVRPFLERDGEPLSRVSTFDTMRLFYVALSRAENLLALPYFKSRGNYINEAFREMIAEKDLPTADDFDVENLPDPNGETDDDLPDAYSFTADYLRYETCPRRYMVFREYDFAPSEAQTQFFGSLVHQTLEDLHHFLISRRSEQ